MTFSIILFQLSFPIKQNLKKKKDFQKRKMLLSAHDSNRVLLWGALHKHWLLHCNWHFRSLFGIACSEHGMYSLITESGKTWRGGGAGETRASVLNVTAAGSICYLRCDKSTLVWVHPGRTWKMQPKMVWEEWIWKMSTEMEGRVGRKKAGHPF